MWELDCKEGRAQKNWCFWIVSWRRLFRVAWTARSNQSVLQEINPEYSWEGLMLKLKLQSFGHLMRRANSLEKTRMLGKIEDRRRRGWQWMRWLDGITDSKDISLSKLWEMVKGRGDWHGAVHGVSKSLTRLSGWTTIAEGGAEPETGWTLETFKNSDVFSNSLSLVSSKEVTVSFPLLEASKYQSKQVFHSVWSYSRLFLTVYAKNQFWNVKRTLIWPF